MEEYHKIQTVFKRDAETKFKTLLDGEYSLDAFKYLKDNNWIFTEKIDGTNVRIVFDGENVEFGGRTDNAQIPTFLFSKLMDMFARGNKLKDNFPDGCCLYGEGYGAKIQKGGGNYIKDGVDFILFDVKIGKWWLKRKDVEDIAIKLGVKIVPVIGNGTLKEMVDLVRGGLMSEFGDFKAEGIVAKPEIEMYDRNASRVITKIKHKDFD